MATTNKTKTGIIAEFLGVSLLAGFILGTIPAVLLSAGMLALTNNAELAGWTFVATLVVGIACVLFCLYAAADYLAYEHARYYN